VRARFAILERTGGQIFNGFHGEFKGVHQPTLLDKYIKNNFQRPVPRKANRYTPETHSRGGPGSVGLQIP
jgi:hypothetical protein